MLLAPEGFFVAVAFGLCVEPWLVFCRRCNTTAGCSGGCGVVLVEVGVVGVGVVVVVVLGGGGVGAGAAVAVVSAGGSPLAVTSGIVETSARWDASALPVKGRLRLAAVRPPPARAPRTARRALRRAPVGGVMPRFRSSAGRPMCCGRRT